MEDIPELVTDLKETEGKQYSRPSANDNYVAKEPELPVDTDKKIPITIITGYLGSGKSTLLQNIGKNSTKKLAIILNEFGDSSAIEKLVTIQNSNDAVQEWLDLGNGCLCCTVKDNGVVAIEQLIARSKGSIDYILLETTGIADPAPIAKMFWLDEGLASNVYIDSVITVLDSENILTCLDDVGGHWHRQNNHLKSVQSVNPDDVTEEELRIEKNQLEEGITTAHLQIALADVLLVNKMDLINEEKLAAICSRVRKINASAPIYSTLFGDIDLDKILDRHAFEASLDKLTTSLSYTTDASFHDDRISTITLLFPFFTTDNFGAVDMFLRYILWENKANGKDIEVHRVKGILVKDGETRDVRVIQGVRDTYDVIKGGTLADGVKENKLVLIGKGLNKLDLEIELNSPILASTHPHVKKILSQLDSTMSGNEPPASPSTTGETPKPKVKKQWKSPALRMMGIPRFSLPSRNWLIFWTVLAGIGGGIAYDKYEQKQIRAKWMKHVEHLSQEAYPNDRIPRKMSIFIAPPPDNFLDVSMKYFRKYVKPVLNAAAVDYEVYSENRQGDIRASVAEKIRELRRERSGVENTQSDQNSRNNSPKDMLASFKKLTGGAPKSEDDEEVLVKRLDLYKVRDVLGFYYFNDTIYPHRDDELDPEKAGGVICIGRGAFKEYMAGVHEGLLGPLEAPEPTVEKVSEIKNEDGNSDATVSTETKAEVAETTIDEETGETKEETNPVPKPFIRPEQYADAELAPELDTSRQVLNDKKVPVLFEQPVYVFALPTIVGFTNTPRKIYRFFNQRYEADDFCRRTAQLVDNKSRPFEYKDQFMAKEEESEWPKKWVQKGKDKGSEWVQELVVDDRIAQRFRVFEVDEK